MRPVVSLLLTLTVTAPAAAQISADSSAMIDKVFAPVNRTDGPGCSVGVNRNAQAIYRRGFGMASLESRVPMTEFSVIESGSVAKQFTAGAITLLALQRKLDLDEPIRKYIPELPDYGSPVTIRMALHHTSGIRDMWTLFALTGQPSGSVLFTMDQALRMVYRQKELNFAPNSDYLYSNSGYLLLAEIVQRVSGRPLSQFSQDEFFKPLGMTQTQWRDDWNRVVPGRVTAYSPKGSGFEVDMPFMSVYGAGGLLTTVGDVLKWTDHFDHPTIGGKVWADTMQHVGKLTTGRDITYAFGLTKGTYNSQAEVSHGGATGGYRTYLGRFPDKGLSIAVFCNAANANPDRLAHQVADVFLGARPSETAAAGNRPQGNQNTATATPVTAAEATQLAGTYYSDELGVTYTLQPKDGGLVLAVGDAKPEPVTKSGTDALTRGPMTMQFSRGKNGKVDGFLLMAGRVKNLRFAKR